MRKTQRLIPAVALLLLAASPAALRAEDALPQGGPITCAAPIAPTDTRESILARFGKDNASLQQLDGAEGESYTALVLFPQEIAAPLRLELGFAEPVTDGGEGAKATTDANGNTLSGPVDNGPTEVKIDPKAKVGSLMIRDTGKGSRWTILGLTIGSTLADVEKANGKPFTISGFDWDYGGYVTDWKDGALSRPMEGGCTVTMQFGTAKNVPQALSGDKPLGSNLPALKKLGPVLTSIQLNFPVK